MSANCYIGIMTGTSLDGIDACIVTFDPIASASGILVEGFLSTPFPDELREILYRLATEELVRMELLARTHFLLPRLYATAVNDLLESAKFESSSVRAIGMHGQTIRHLPIPAPVSPVLEAVGATFQLGSGPALAALTGIDVVSDFRAADVALGGHGAPLVPMFDAAFLRSSVSDRILLNIGGIANLTFLPATSPSNQREVVAFDCGPGNMIIDLLMERYFGEPFDLNGRVAASGRVHEQILDQLMSHPYFSTAPPKSTGRELFGSEFASIFEDAINRGVIAPSDAVATATKLTAKAFAQSLGLIADWNGRHNSKEIIVSGGGAKNLHLLQLLRQETDATVFESGEIGIPVEMKEAIAFAFFAKAYVEDIFIHLPGTTGANARSILGSLSKGGRQSHMRNQL